FSSPGKDASLARRRFRLRDVPGAVMKERQARPRDLIVWLQLDGFLTRQNRFVKLAEFHQCHAERVPAVEKSGIDLDAAPIFFDRRLQLADSEVAVCVVKKLIDFRVV